MSRGTLLLALLLAFSLPPPDADAQQAARVYRIGFVSMRAGPEDNATARCVPAGTTGARLRGRAERDPRDSICGRSRGETSGLRRRAPELARTHRLPALYPFSLYPETGGLVSYGPSFQEAAHRAAGYVDRILKGARPADLPVEQPTKFELVINAKTARALGLRIPQSVLVRADRIIE